METYRIFEKTSDGVLRARVNYDKLISDIENDVPLTDHGKKIVKDAIDLLSRHKYCGVWKFWDEDETYEDAISELASRLANEFVNDVYVIHSIHDGKRTLGLKIELIEAGGE